MRGSIGDRPREEVEQLFVDTARVLCDYAAPQGVGLLLEPVNRYEIDFINNVAQGARLMDTIDRPNMKLMPDVFHMNIEDTTIGGELVRNADYIGYVHVADSNRFAPGQGHTDFDDILGALRSVHYDGWLSVEILPHPDPDTAARQAVEFLKPKMNHGERQGHT